MQMFAFAKVACFIDIVDRSLLDIAFTSFSQQPRDFTGPEELHKFLNIISPLQFHHFRQQYEVSSSKQFSPLCCCRRWRDYRSCFLHKKLVHSHPFKIIEQLFIYSAIDANSKLFMGHHQISQSDFRYPKGLSASYELASKLFRRGCLQLEY